MRVEMCAIVTTKPHLDGWHRVYMNRERFAKHARQIAFLD